MSKILLFLLFAFVLNYKEDGIEVYDDYNKMQKLANNVYSLNVTEGEEFYIRFVSEYGQSCSFLNYNETTNALYDFDLKGKQFKYIPQKRLIPICGGTPPGILNFYKFKAMKPSFNKIALKFRFNAVLPRLSYISLGNFVKVIKINILPKNKSK